MLQSLVCISGRPQARTPPPFTHFLVRVLEPRPQVTEHRLHDDHSSHRPCTANTHKHTHKHNMEMRHEGDKEGGGASHCKQLENERNTRSSMSLKAFLNGNTWRRWFPDLHKNIPAKGKEALKMRLHLHLSIWKKMDVRDGLSDIWSHAVMRFELWKGNEYSKLASEIIRAFNYYIQIQRHQWLQTHQTLIKELKSFFPASSFHFFIFIAHLIPFYHQTKLESNKWTVDLTWTLHTKSAMHSSRPNVSTRAGDTGSLQKVSILYVHMYKNNC